MPWPGMQNYIAEHFIKMLHGRFDATAERNRYASCLADVDPGGQFVPCVSYETLTGDPVTGTFDGHTVAERLFKVFPDAKVLVVIRNQRSLIASSYYEYIRRRGTAGIGDYIPARQYSSGYHSPCREDWLDFDSLLQTYELLFGIDRICVVPMEWLSSNIESLASRLSDRIGVTAPVGASGREYGSWKPAVYPLVCQVNRFCSCPHAGLVSGENLFFNIARQASIRFGSRIPRIIQSAISNQVDAKIDALGLDQYRDGNASIALRYDLPLADLGYVC